MKCNCATCGKEIDKSPTVLKKSKTGNVYCSRKCATINNNKLFKKWINHPQYIEGRTIYRKLKIESVIDPKCEICGFDNPIALEVHHLDEDRKNNKIENLQILCCNCHRIKHKTKRVVD